MLYESFGFTYCSPFGDYLEDPKDLLLTRTIDPS